MFPGPPCHSILLFSLFSLEKLCWKSVSSYAHHCGPMLTSSYPPLYTSQVFKSEGTPMFTV